MFAFFKFRSRLHFALSILVLLSIFTFEKAAQAQWAAMATADISNFFKRQYEKTHGHGNAYNASGSHIVILHAMWGEGTNWANVTERIDPAKYCSNPFSVNVSTRPPNIGGSRCNIPLEWSVLGDPSSGQDKFLRVLFTCVYPGLSLPYIVNNPSNFLDAGTPAISNNPAANWLGLGKALSGINNFALQYIVDDFSLARSFDTTWRLDPEGAKTMSIGCLPQHPLNGQLDGDPTTKKMKERWIKYLGNGWNCEIHNCNLLRRNILPVRQNEFFANMANGFVSWQGGEFASPPQNAYAFLVRDPANYSQYKYALDQANGDHSKVNEILQMNWREHEAVKHDRLQPHNQKHWTVPGLAVQ